MIEILTHLFDSSGFPPRWKCGDWSADLGWLHILSDLGVWTAYVAIPLVLLYFVLRKRNVPFRGVFVLFGAFILACGTTHLMEAIIFWWPGYRLAGVIKLFTALVSWATVFALVRIAPQALAMRSAEELAREQAARNAAEEGLRVRDRFLAIASHELRTPLNPLRINIHMLLKAAQNGSLHADSPMSGKVVGLLESADRQVRQFGKLVDDLLDVSRMAAGRLELQVEEVDLAAITRDVLERFVVEIERAGCTLQLRIEPTTGFWDRTRLEQVVVNLLANAIRYGRGTRIEVEVGTVDRTAFLTIRDHGIGIDSADHERIFDRFERAVGSYDFDGLGMGLFIVRQIVAAHGGTIRVESERGQGACFRVELPREASRSSVALGDV